MSDRLVRRALPRLLAALGSRKLLLSFAAFAVATTALVAKISSRERMKSLTAVSNDACQRCLPAVPASSRSPRAATPVAAMLECRERRVLPSACGGGQVPSRLGLAKLAAGGSGGRLALELPDGELTEEQAAEQAGARPPPSPLARKARAAARHTSFRNRLLVRSARLLQLRVVVGSVVLTVVPQSAPPITAARSQHCCRIAVLPRSSARRR